MPDTPPTIGSRLRRLREERSISQVDLAASSGLRQATISDIECGRKLSPRADTLVRLARAMGVRVGRLLEDE